MRRALAGQQVFHKHSQRFLIQAVFVFQPFDKFGSVLNIRLVLPVRIRKTYKLHLYARFNDSRLNSYSTVIRPDHEALADCLVFVAWNFDEVQAFSVADIHTTIRFPGFLDHAQVQASSLHIVAAESLPMTHQQLVDAAD